MIRILALLSFLMTLSPFVVGAATFQSSSSRTHLIELYTSEGCSSCPPADAFLKSFKGKKGLWKEFIPIGFHVTYWDYIGWKDPYGSQEFTQRQRQYAAFWKSRSVYTPCYALNGEEWKSWYKGGRLPDASNDNSGILKIETMGQLNYKVTFNPSSNSSDQWQAHLSLLAFDEISDVKRGENHGKSLHHEFVVIDLAEDQMNKEQGVFQKILKVEKPSHLEVSRLGVAAWVTRKGDMRPVQATGGYL